MDGEDGVLSAHSLHCVLVRLRGLQGRQELSWVLMTALCPLGAQDSDE